MRIAVFICGVIFDSQKRFVLGIEQAVRENNDVCSVFCCFVNVSGNNPYLKGEYSIFSLPDLKTFDGIILVKNTLTSPTEAERITREIIESGTPCVSIDHFEKTFVNISTDEQGSMEKVATHLIECHDKRKLFFVAGPFDSSDTRLRYQGFRAALAKYRIFFTEKWVYRGNFEYASGIEAVKYFLDDLKEMPDAIVCANDEMAVGVCMELKARGLRIPEDIAVTGIDHDSVSRTFSPRISTVVRKQYEKGYRAIEVLHHYNEYKPGDNIVFPIVTKYYESCGCEKRERTDITSLRNQLAVDDYLKSELTQLIKRMTADLMAHSDYADLIKEIRNYADTLGAKEMYLCMNKREEIKIDYSDYTSTIRKSDDSVQEDYADTMITISAYKDGHSINEVNGQIFERSDLFPSVANFGTPGGTYYFLPVHYMERNFGYAILGDSGELMLNDFFPSWITIVSNAFENARKQNVMTQMIEALDRMWIYDTLTGIYNRAGFFKLSEAIVDDCIHNKVPVCVVFMDVDGLKSVNDEYGHDEGDCLIKDMAAILKSVKHHGEIIMRYGGDEFVLLAAGYTNKQAEECVEKIQMAIDAHNARSTKEYDVEASIGFCITSIESREQLNNIIEEADHEMYKVKYVKKALKRKNIR